MDYILEQSGKIQDSVIPYAVIKIPPFSKQGGILLCKKVLSVYRMKFIFTDIVSSASPISSVVPSLI